MDDLISIIVPIYRVEKYLEKCIESICNQTYSNLEIILVDDGSDDSSPQICDFYAEKDSRIKVIHKGNAGADSARKAGMKLASGKYIGYVDGDDWVEPEMYETLITYAQKYDVDVVESGVIDSYEDNEKKRHSILEEGCYKGQKFIGEVEPRLVYSGDFFCTGILMYLVNKLFLKEKIEKYQMLQGACNTIQDDMMVSLPCIAETKSVYITHECFYHYRVRTDSTKRAVRDKEVQWIAECYREFYKRFSMGKNIHMNKQINYYIMYYLLLKAPYVFDDEASDNYLRPYGNIKKDKKIVIYGAGAAGIHLKSYVQSTEQSNLVYWADKNYKNLKSIGDISDPKGILEIDYDYIILAILRDTFSKEAKRELLEMGVKKEKILWIKQEYIDSPELLLGYARLQGKVVFNGLEI